MPSELGMVTDMSVLSLESNQLTKAIPSQLGHLSGLNWLMLYDNQITGLIPSELGLLGNLTWLRLEKNSNVRGSLPTELVGLSSLEHVTFQGTSLSGSIPMEFCEMIDEGQLMVGVDCNEVHCECGCMCY